MVSLRRDSVACEAVFDAGESTTIESDDRAAGLGDANKLRNIASHPGDARHFCQIPSVECDRNMIAHLRGT